MLVLNAEEMARLLPLTEISLVIGAVEAGFVRLAQGGVVMPQRNATPVAAHNGLHLTMPAFVAGAEASGTPDALPDALTVKIVTVYGDNPARHGLPTIQGVLLLHDASTGRPVALMDAEHLTAMRTGAVSGAATRALARSDARTVLLFGAGAQAAAQLAAVCAVRPVERAEVITRTGRQDAGFCGQMSRLLNISVEPVVNLPGAVEAAVSRAHILCTATNSAVPLFDGAWLAPGTHINAVGAYTRHMRELDSTAVARSRLFVDHADAAQAEAGDVVIPMQAGEIPADHVAGSLGDLLLGKVAGRPDDRAITLFKSVGLAMQDAVTAPLAYARAVAQGAGTEIDLG